MYPYCHKAARLEWSNYPESYAGGRVSTDKAFHARDVKGDDPDKKGYRGPPGSGLDVGVKPHPMKNMFCREASKIGNRKERQFWKRLKSTKYCNARRRTRMIK